MDSEGGMEFVVIPRQYAFAGKRGVIVPGSAAGGSWRDDVSVEVQVFLKNRKKEPPRIRVWLADLDLPKDR